MRYWSKGGRWLDLMNTTALPIMIYCMCVCVCVCVCVYEGVCVCVYECVVCVHIHVCTMHIHALVYVSVCSKGYYLVCTCVSLENVGRVCSCSRHFFNFPFRNHKSLTINHEFFMLNSINMLITFTHTHTHTHKHMHGLFAHTDTKWMLHLEF